MKFTEEQLNNFKAYEKIRSSGRYNMFDRRAIIASGLSQNEYLFVMENYLELETASLDMAKNC